MRSARSGAPWVTKFGKLFIRENLLWRSVRPPTRTHNSCKPMSNVTIDLAQLDTSLSVMLPIRISVIRLTAVKIRHPLTIITWSSRGLRWKTSRFALHISWYSMSHLPIQHKIETTPGRAVYARAKLSSIDSCQNGTCADHYQETINVGSAQVLDLAFRPHYKPDWNVLLTLVVNSPLIRIFAILMKVNWQLSN